MTTVIAAFLVQHLCALEGGHGTVSQSQRQIPCIASVDVAVVGATVAGVAAAESAARDGATVFLVAPRPYLGEDLCGTLRLEPEDDHPPATELEKKILQTGRTTTPAHVKATLAAVLLDAGVTFTFASYVTDVLRDTNGKACGVVIANRAGRQAIIAKTIIDATEYAWVCRSAGCASAPWPGGTVRFGRTVLQGEGNRGKKGSKGRRFKSRTHTLEIPMRDLSFASLAEAEQVARDKTYTPDVLRGAESLFCVPPNPIVCRKSQKDFAEGEPVDLEHFRPKEQDRLYVLSGCAAIPRSEAAQLTRPGAMAAVGVLLGRAAAAEAKALPRPGGVHVAGQQATGTPPGDVRESLHGARPTNTELPGVPSKAGSLPVLADVDVVVVGGGTAGAPAAIAAARRGLRTFVIEYQEGLGGVGTLGLIGKPYHGKKIGFAKEVPFPRNIEQKMEWYRREIRKAGGTIWFGALGCGAFVEGRTVKGAVVCTPEGRGVVLARVVIDATGNADVAISAGAGYMYGAVDKGDIALQGAGVPTRSPGDYYNNTDYLLVDESDMVDVWRTLVSVHLSKAGSFDVGSLIQTRERRRVIGDFVMRYVDQIAGRTYPDSVVFSGSDYDSHGYPSSRLFALLPHDAKSRKANHPAPGGSCFTPYRCLLPRGLDGILVIGLGISMDRDATAMVRMQLDMANQGYAAGVAASMAVKAGTQPRHINVRALQQHLVDIGGLPAAALTDKESFPLPEQGVRQAVQHLAEATNPSSAGQALAIILTHQDTAQPLLAKAYAAADGPAKLKYAQALGVLGDKTGVPTLVAELSGIPAWDPKILQGRMAEYAHLPTPLDATILALGLAGDRSGTPAIMKMLDRLDAGVTLSHHRAVALALEHLGDPTAAEPLAKLLQKRGMHGHAMAALPTEGKIEERTASLREITLARALYRCGDHQGLGRRILEAYRRDFRGLFARHAQAVLSGK